MVFTSWFGLLSFVYLVVFFSGLMRFVFVRDKGRTVGRLVGVLLVPCVEVGFLRRLGLVKHVEGLFCGSRALT